MEYIEGKHRELKLFLALAGAGMAAALFHVHIPHSEAVIDGRWAFGFMGFALLGRWWTALVLVTLLSYPYGTPDLPLWIGFGGNMLYAVPSLLAIRPLSGWMLRRWGPGGLFALGWGVLVLFCYQAFATPVVWGVITLMKGRPVGAGLMDGWRTQPFLVESILVALFSAAALVAALAVEHLRSQRRRLAHINSVLLGIRNVNQLIVTEADPKRLVERACVNLTETMGYRNAWIALMGGAAGAALGLPRQSPVSMAASAGFNGGFELLRERLQRGEFSACMKRALENDDTIVSGDPVSDCTDCPLSEYYAGRAGLARRLAFDGVTYGIMMASVPPGYAGDAEEQNLFNEVTGDLAFALHKIATARRLEESRQHLGLVIEGSGIGTWEWNVQTNETVFNDKWGAMLGYTSDELTPHDYATWERLVHPKDLVQARDALTNCVEGRTPGYSCEFRMQHKDGRQVWVLCRGRIMTRDPKGKPLSMFGTHTDITEIKQAEEALRKSEWYLRSTIDGLSAHIAVLNDQGEIILTNKSYRDFGERNGIEPRLALEGTNYLAVCDIASGQHSEEATPFAKGIREVLSGKRQSFELEYPCHSPDEQRWFIGRVTPFTAEGPRRVVVAHENITERKQAEEALRLEHAMLARTEAVAHVGSWEWEAEGDKTTWSDELFRIFGLEPADEAPPFVEQQGVYVPKDYARLTQAVEECVKNGVPYMLDLHVVRADGELRHCFVRGFPERDADGVVRRLYGSLEDITEIKRAEEHITILSRMLDEAPAAITIHDAEGCFVFANAAAASLHGYESMEEFMEINLHELDVPESEAVIADRMREIAEEGEARFEVEHHRKDGSTFPLDVLAKRIEWEGRPAILSIAADITERRQAEELIAASEEKFRLAFMTSPDAININRMSDGQYIEVNEGFLRIMGYKQEEVIGRTSLELNIWKNPEDRKRLVERLQADDYVENMSAQFYRSDGTIREGLMSACVIELNEVKCILSITRDVTERRKAEAEREELQVRLNQAQKMESVGRLAGGVAHDFNNMLNVILGHTELALDGLPVDSPLRDDLKEVRKAAERSANLTRQLLAFARKQTVAPRVLDLNETIASMLKMLERLIGEDIDLLWKPGTRLALIRIDPGQVDQMLANLAVNARDAIGHRNGKVTIETSNACFDEDYCADHAGFTPGDYVMLTVSDDGCGMDEEVRAQIFEPFFTTKGVGEGTGLGLATIYGIVKQNNGFVNVYSEPGKGTIFRIYLPALEAESRRHDDPRTTYAPPVGGDEIILVVEDEAAILNLARTMLERLGYTVLTAGTPTEAKRLIEEQSCKIDMVLTDVVMPEMNGRDLVKSLQESCPDIRCLFMSGYTANVIAHQGVLDEGVDFVQKPFSLRDLARKVREALES